MRIIISILLGIGTLAASDAIHSGYRGDRNGWYPDATPPTTWDEASKKNLAWKTVLPNWCYGLPIVVGQKVFVMSEPGWKSDFPELVCVDLETGKILWQRVVDHLELAIPDAAQREKVRAAWASLLERMRNAYQLCHESWNTDPKDDAKVADIARRAGELGGELGDKYRPRSFGNQPSSGGYGVLRGWGSGDKPGPDPKHGITNKNLREYGLRLETFYGFGTGREGECFSTPATDGTFIYIVTEQGTHACFDLEGKLMWMRWIRPGFNKGGHDDSICSSPLLCDGLFITTLHMASPNADRTKHTNPIIALDAKTGKTVWETTPAKGFNDGCSGSSKTLDLGGTRVLITNGGYVLRVKDGKELCIDISGREMKSQTECSVDDASDTVFYSPAKGQGTEKVYVAKRLALNGDTLTVTEAWRVPVSAGFTTAVHDGKVYTGSYVIDIATGNVSKNWPGKGCRTRWLLAIANGHLYGMDQDGTATVFDLKGDLVATNKVINEVSDPELIARQIAISANEQMRKSGPNFSYSAPFTFAGKRILMRSYSHLYCFARP